VTGQLEPAAILLAYSERNGFRPLLLATQQDRLDSVIAAQPQHAEWEARASRLTRDEAVEVAIAGLEG
jgi:hypothetical protein